MGLKVLNRLQWVAPISKFFAESQRAVDRSSDRIGERERVSA